MKKPVHIIIDSADKLGKTTQCLMLSRVLDVPYVKMPNMREYIEKGKEEEFSKLFNETIVQFRYSDFVLDRGFTSSVVYSTVLNRKFDLSYINRIEEILDPVVFIFSGKPFKKDDVYDKNVIQKVNDEFVRIANKKHYHLIDVTDKTELDIHGEIRNILKNEHGII